MGSHYNVFGAAIGLINPYSALTRNLGQSYGEYMAYDGEIIGGAVNIALGTVTPPPYKIVAANYNTGAASIIANVGALSDPGGYGSASSQFVPGGFTFNPGDQTGLLNGLALSGGGVQSNVSFSRGEYIGIFVGGTLVRGAIGLDIAIEGTLYLNI
jgi:hypothetical protein